ncbi:LysR family transcriptional regulator [Elioraea rosea]|uniref:LysR family transcriptional regulator n=1 Tax=Elioraea rosea TaxID=2492390 RepID=UPI0013150EB1|nr:LysR family transcriptional regulator [Elioraea rosea]
MSRAPEPSDLDWDDLKVLLAVARSGSLNAASQTLGMDQATVSRRLAALEAALGAILFVRGRQGLSPTGAGEAAIARAVEIEGRALQLYEEVANANQEVAGLVRIIGNAWTMTRLAERALPGLLARHPRLDIRTIGGSVPRSIAQGEAALALWFEIPANDTAFAIRLGEVPYAIYAKPGLDPDTLGWVSFWDDMAPRRAPSRWIEKTRKAGEGLRLTATDSSVLRAGIKAGIGKGLLPMCLAEGDAELARVTEGPPDLVRMLHVHAHPDTLGTARVQAVLTCLHESFAATFLPPGFVTAAQ